MLKNPYFDISQAFKDLDTEEKGFISQSDIGKYLSQHNIDISTTNQELIFLRFNKRSHADKINYAEFIEEMTPRATVIPN
jgi:Ca2+-binding EF-hand superfamily protein